VYGASLSSSPGVDTEDLLRAEPQLSGSMGLVVARPGSLTPIAQDPLEGAPLDEQLAGVVFGPEVLGVVLTAGVEGVASGEFAACCWLNVQPLNAKTTATTDAEIPPLMPGP